MFNNIEEIKRAHTGHFFDSQTMRFFNSRILDTIYNGHVFITSEKSNYGDSQRLFTVRIAFDNGDLETVGNFNELSKYEAVKLAKRITPEYVKVLKCALDAFNHKTNRAKNLKFLGRKKNEKYVEMIKEFSGRTDSWFYESIKKAIKKGRF